MKFSELVFEKLDEICPTQEVKLSKLDGQVTSIALQKLARLRLREYTENGNSDRFKEIKKLQKARRKLECQKAIDKSIVDAGGKGMKWMREAKRISLRPGDDSSTTFTLPAHIDSNFTAQQSAEAIAEYFSKISQEFTPIEEDQSASWLEAETKLNNEPCCHPSILEHQIYNNMKASNITDSVPGDIPARILKEFLPEFAFPVTNIIKEAVSSHIWPQAYKKEYHLPLKKVPSPQSEDELRGIGLTNWASKQIERFVLNWIWPYLRSHIDPDQMGGMPGCSIEHYIIKMVDFILRSMDGDPDSAVVAVPVDYSKAFNRMLHSDILCNLVALNVPNCAVKLIKSYLTQRTMCVRYKGAVSSFYKVPGGGPQGGLLTSVLFILQVNKAGSPCLPSPRQDTMALPVNQNESAQDPTRGHDFTGLPANQTGHSQESIGDHDATLLPENQTEVGQYAIRDQDISSQSQPPVPRQNANPLPANQIENSQDPFRGQSVNNVPICHQSAKLHKNSFIDDLTMLEKMSLSKLVQKERIIGPLNFHDRFNLVMPESESILQHQLADLKDYTSRHHMVLNHKKTKCIPFISSKTKDFMPQLNVNDDDFLEVIYDLKLVGMVVTSDLTWHKHIEYTIKRVNSVIWQLTRFKQNGATQDKLKTFYVLKIRSILMFGSVCFHSSLSSELSHKLELQQKRSFAIMLGTRYRSYQHACSLLDLPRLDLLREKACLKWAIKSQANPKHSHLFPLKISNVETRQKNKYIEYLCHTDKYYKSAVPYMTRILNSHEENKPTKISIVTNSGISIVV